MSRKLTVLRFDEMVTRKPRLLKDLVISFLAHSAILSDIPLKRDSEVMKNVEYVEGRKV